MGARLFPGAVLLAVCLPAAAACPVYFINRAAADILVDDWRDGTCCGWDPVVFRILASPPPSAGGPYPEPPQGECQPLTGAVRLWPGATLELSLGQSPRDDQVSLYRVRLAEGTDRRSWNFHYSVRRFRDSPGVTTILGDGFGASRQAFRQPDPATFDRLEFTGPVASSSR